MTNPLLWIFVEGTDDKRFFESVITPLLKDVRKCEVKCYEYQQKPSKKVNDFLKNIRAAGHDYIFVTDIDTSSCITRKKGSKVEKISNLDSNKIVVVKREIESWYHAGLDSVSCKRLGLPDCSLTESVSKEDFEGCNRNYVSMVAYKIEVLSHFSLPIAKAKNSSFRYFTDKYNICIYQ